LIFQRVEQKRVLEGLGRAGAERTHLLELAIGQRMGIRQQPADDRALAVVHVPADDDVHALARHQRSTCASFRNWRSVRPASSWPRSFQCELSGMKTTSLPAPCIVSVKSKYGVPAC